MHRKILSAESVENCGGATRSFFFASTCPISGIQLVLKRESQSSLAGLAGCLT